MLQLYSRVHTAPVFSELDERECGICENCIVDFAEIKVVALEVSQKALLHSNKKILLLEAVVEWTDSLSIQSCDDLVDTVELVRLETILENPHSLLSLPVQTITGDSVGIVTDYLFDDVSGLITKLHVGSTGLLTTDTDRIIARDSIVRITADAVIVHDGSIPLAEATEQKQVDVRSLSPEPSFIEGTNV